MGGGLEGVYGRFGYRSEAWTFKRSFLWDDSGRARIVIHPSLLVYETSSFKHAYNSGGSKSALTCLDLRGRGARGAPEEAVGCGFNCVFVVEMNGVSKSSNRGTTPD